jgi:MFS family permease
MPRRTLVVAVIGTTQTIAWASSYYMPAILGAPVARALHLPTSLFSGLFSGALLLSALIGPAVGRVIDHYGGRPVLALSNLVLAAGLAALAAAHGVEHPPARIARGQQQDPNIAVDDPIGDDPSLVKNRVRRRLRPPR